MIYLDHNATTPMAPEALEALQPWLHEQYGNASSQHKLGRQARAAVERAREQVARLLAARAEEIVFTSGGSESNNLALQGTLRGEGQPHIITSQIEHPSVKMTCRALEKRGCRVTSVPVDSQSRVDPASVASAITDHTALVSIMHANNEVGTVQPIAEIGALCRKRGVLCHTDAVQTIGTLPVDVKALGVDLLSLSGHKLYGPKGVGALYVRKDTPLRPLIHGGKQEGGRRGGTEAVALIVGLGRAAELTLQQRSEHAARIAALRDRLYEGLRGTIDGMHRRGHPTDTLPGTLALGFEGIEGEALVLMLDQEGICASTGSACSSGRMTPSHVLLAMGLDPSSGQGPLRLSLGRGNTPEEIERVVAVLPALVKRLRALAETSSDATHR